RAARHPSETAAYLMTRVLAYCLEYEEGIAFTEGISATDEPAVLVRDATGSITAWIEVGAPDAERLHRGSRLADRTTTYPHRGRRARAAQHDERLGDRAPALCRTQRAHAELRRARSPAHLTPPPLTRPAASGDVTSRAVRGGRHKLPPRNVDYAVKVAVMRER